MLYKVVEMKELVLQSIYYIFTDVWFYLKNEMLFTSVCNNRQQLHFISLYHNIEN